jgi:hypothetical protein
MSGSARAGTISREANAAYGNVLIRSRSALSGARPEIVCFFVDFDLHGCRLSGQNSIFGVTSGWAVTQPELDFRPVNGVGGLRKPRIPDGEELLQVGTVLR